MKTYIFLPLLMLFVKTVVFGQSPNWKVNENNFQYTMSFVGFLNVDGTTLSGPNDKVAAFVDGECRGVASLTYASSENRYYAYLIVHANTSNETVNFKIYDASKNVIKDALKTVTFVTGEHHGNLFQAFCFSSTLLKTGVNILDFNFKNATRNQINVGENEITIYLSKNQSVVDLIPEYITDLGATVFLNGAEQVSGQSSLDFTKPVQLKVRSEDQSTVKDWTIVVKQVEEKATFYKKDALCYNGGSIKVLYPTPNEQVVLVSNGVNVATSYITNGEVVFNNLAEGTYTVKLSAETKVIKINLK